MSLLLYHIVLLVFLTGRNPVLGETSSDALECGDDKSCKAMAKLMASVNEIQNILDRQGKDLEELKVDIKKNLNSTGAIREQLERKSTDLLTLEGRSKAQDASKTNQLQLVQSIYGAEMGPRDCSDVQSKGYTVSGIYRVYPGSDDKRIEADVYCDFKTPGQGWLVFQRRIDGSVNFQRFWKDYENGFGSLDHEFWLGNEKLSLLTMNRKYKLRIDLESFTGQKGYAEYSTFSVRPATDKYRLTVGGYSGIAGDSFSYQSGMQFSTIDVDNDAYGANCAQIYGGAWWFRGCHHSNLNGVYLTGYHTSAYQGIYWNTWYGGYYSHKATEMKIAAVF